MYVCYRDPQRKPWRPGRIGERSSLPGRSQRGYQPEQGGLAPHVSAGQTLDLLNLLCPPIPATWNYQSVNGSAV
jgi:hypothetical protein